MAVTSGYAIDRQLAQMYFDKVTVNLEKETVIDPEKIWEGMQLIAMRNRTFLNIKKG